MKNTMSKILITALAFVLALVTVQAVVAAPYDGVNRMGSYYQYTATAEYTYNYDYSGSTGYYDYAAGKNYYYGYPFAARTGGFFGNDVSHLIGLRPGVYYPFGPSMYSVRAHPTCPYPYCHTGAAGFPRTQYGDIRVRSRLGGIFGY